MSLFRRILLTLWPKRREDGAAVVAPEVQIGAQMCVAASGCFIPCSESQVGEFAACASRTSQHAIDFTSATWTLAPRVGSHVIGMTSAKGFGCA